jgi:hypothetical protein
MSVPGAEPSTSRTCSATACAGCAIDNAVDSEMVIEAQEPSSGWSSTWRRSASARCASTLGVPAGVDAVAAPDAWRRTCCRRSCPRPSSRELTEYAMSFVKRNEFDLLDTLLDINAHDLSSEYAVQVAGSTNGRSTSAFEVYANRRGVCQDFTNLLICLARLLGVPARYVCGYVYCGPRATSDAARATRGAGRGVARVGPGVPAARSGGRASTRRTGS